MSWRWLVAALRPFSLVLDAEETWRRAPRTGRSEEALRFTQYTIDNTVDQAFWMMEDGCLLVNWPACRASIHARSLKPSTPISIRSTS
jgi:hypothetical protein